MKIKMIKDEIVLLPTGPVRWLAGNEFGPADGLSPALADSLKGRGFAVDVEPVEEKLSPQQKAAKTRAAKKAKKDAEVVAAEIADEEVED